MLYDGSPANAYDALSFNLNCPQIQSFGIEYFPREIGNGEEIVFEVFSSGIELTCQEAKKYNPFSSCPFIGSNRNVPPQKELLFGRYKTHRPLLSES